MCTGTRQEFILLSDTLGVSMLVDAINHDHQGAVTESTVLGPFYVEGPPEAALGSDISGELPGEPMYVSGTVAAADGSPLAGAIVDVWHSDETTRSISSPGRASAPMSRAASTSGR